MQNPGALTPSWSEDNGNIQECKNRIILKTQSPYSVGYIS